MRQVVAVGVLAVLACGRSGPPTSPPVSALTFVHIAAGGTHTCALTTDAAAYCWGNNEAGQLGTGAASLGASAPRLVSGGLTFSTVVVGHAHTCGLTLHGAAYCWGDNESGILGAGSSDRAAHPSPEPVSGGLVFRSLTAGGMYPYGGDIGHTCGLTPAGAAYCWGSNRFGDLGIGVSDTLAHPVPAAVSGGLIFQSLSASPGRTCGVTASGETYCWGAHTVVGDTAGSNTPALVPGGLTLVTLRAGGSFACGLTAAGIPLCWGANSMGALGNGDSIADPYPLVHTPAAVVGGRTFQSLAAGYSHACGVTTAGAAYCWGYDARGQLGTAAPVGNCYLNPAWPGSDIPWPCSPVPLPVAGGLAFAAVSGGHNHTCGLTAGNQAYCWGDNAMGQLGDGTTTTRSTPVRVTGQAP